MKCFIPPIGTITPKKSKEASVGREDGREIQFLVSRCSVANSDPLETRNFARTSSTRMQMKWLYTIVFLLLFSVNLVAQETYLVAYAGFAGFQAPVWAPKDLGLFQKYGFNGDVVLVPGSVRQVQAVLGGSIHLAQIAPATGTNPTNQGPDRVLIWAPLTTFPSSFVPKKEIPRPE